MTQKSGSMATKVTTRFSSDLRQEINHHLCYTQGKRLEECTTEDYFQSVSRALRPHILKALWSTEDRYQKASAKRMYYLSLEFLIGRCLRDTLFNLGLYDACKDALKTNHVELSDILDFEPDPALGNGGLGRLAACFLDSLASLGMPGYGYGINYEFGLFRQEIRNGYQHEHPDQWFANESPWTLERRDQACLVPVYGHVDHATDRQGHYNPMWMDWRLLVGVPYYLPIVGHRGRTVNTLRLYAARSSNEFDMSIFNGGDYLRAVEQKISSENISKVLYPSDAVPSGKELRLLQEYFLVACATRDIFRRFFAEHRDLELLPQKVAIQMNDTHPALTVPELMRTLIDEHAVGWDQAWEWTQAVCGYTNHTLMQEALEKWPLALLEHVLPRHRQIILEINHRFLQSVKSRWPDGEGRLTRMSLIEEGPEQQVRMANLAIVGSHATNGVSRLHSHLITENLVPDFAAMWPERFHNKTNGVNHRRWLLHTNPALSSLISRLIGERWTSEPLRLRDLRSHADSAAVQNDFREAKQRAKHELGELIAEKTGIRVNPHSLFDVQIKRIHEYKRQLLNVLSMIDHYLRLTEDGKPPIVPRTWVVAGKAAPGYFMAKLIIKLVNNVSRLFREDRRAENLLSAVFLPDYKVSLAEKIVPAADLSEQISTAGMEASGTGNMKLSMNGALTIGTMDGANIEIAEAVGKENIYIFGFTAEQIHRHQQDRSYDPRKLYEENPRIRRALDLLSDDRLSFGEPGVFQPVLDALLKYGDAFFNLADMVSYLEAQDLAATDYQNDADWSRKALINVSGMGYFSSDRTITEYASETWDIKSY